MTKSQSGFGFAVDMLDIVPLIFHEFIYTIVSFSAFSVLSVVIGSAEGLK